MQWPEWSNPSMRRTAIGCVGIVGVVEMMPSVAGMLAWTACVLVALYAEARIG